MSEADERIEAASSFVLQSPPGEINDVLNGLDPYNSSTFTRLTVHSMY
jgi:hypothetical protein